MDEHHQPAALRFHTNHGRNIRITHDGSMARRTNTTFFSKGLVFTNRPITAHERICVKFLELTDDLGAFFYIGFTTKDPQHFIHTNLANKPGYWTWFFPKNLNNPFNTIPFFYIDDFGHVHYGINQEETGQFKGKVPMDKPLWALVNIFGNLNAIKFIKTPPATQNQQIEPIDPQMAFHRVHGDGVKTTQDSSIATHLRELGRGLLFSARPVKINEKIAIKFLKVPNKSINIISFGFTNKNPDGMFNELPYSSLDLINEAGFWVWPLFKRFNQQNTVLFYYFTGNGEVHFGVNGEEKGTFFRRIDIRRPLWALIDISGEGTKVEMVQGEMQGRSEDVDEEEKNCTVCYDNSIDTVLYLCGHMCMCYECAMKQWQGVGDGHCPLCRAIIKDVIII